ncbi:MAG TPA: TonB-dependent receptor [Candidatus Baltobacteraceae bacterium]
MSTSSFVARVALVVILFSPVALGATLTTIHGRVFDVRSGLPIPSATILLQSSQKTIAQTSTAGDGSFEFRGVAPAGYQITVIARGYQQQRVIGVTIAPGTADFVFRTALTPGTNALQTIAHVDSAAKTIASSSTVTEYANPGVMQQQDILRAGDLLGTLPGVTSNASSSSVGDDATISIRGFDPTETATLLDGHPIGPIGAQGAGYNYAVSPFWGLRDASVTFGSGATGLYGVSTIAGAVNFVTLDPTREPRAIVAQGIGNQDQLLTEWSATGTTGNLGYALAFGVQGTSGLYSPQLVRQSGLLGADANGYPNVTSGNVAANTYAVSGAYDLRNDLAKFTYRLDNKTSIEATAYIATSWVDHTGNGDNDYNPYPYNLYEYGLELASREKTSVVLPDGKRGVCYDTVAFLDNGPGGFGCFTASQAAAMTAGPAGGGPNSFTANRDQDYHVRLTRSIGISQLLVDGFIDNYATDDFSPPGPQIGGYSSDRFLTHGFLVADQLPLSKNNLSFGLYFQHQAHTGDSFNQATDIFGNPLQGIVPFQDFHLSSTSYFASDQWTPNGRSSVFADLWFQHSNNTRVTNFDPRLAYVYRPTNNDTLRLSGGHSYSEPDPALLYALPSLNSDVSGFNPVCGPGARNAIGGVSDPNLKPETATDADLTYAHRFTSGTNLQADVYDATEWNGLLGGTLPLTDTGFSQIPASIINGYLNKIDAFCHNNPTEANLAVGTTYNAAQAHYRGIVLSLDSRLTRFLDLSADYNVESEFYFNLEKSLMRNNVTLIDGGQTGQSPLHTADVGLDVHSGAMSGSFDSHYVGPGNWLDRGGFWYADASISATSRPFTLTLGINNVFNSVAANYGYIGLGTYQPENQYGRDLNAFDQASELFGLPYRGVRFVLTFDSGTSI